MTKRGLGSAVRKLPLLKTSTWTMISSDRTSGLSHKRIHCGMRLDTDERWRSIHSRINGYDWSDVQRVSRIGKGGTAAPRAFRQTILPKVTKLGRMLQLLTPRLS
eukprot:2990251-Rhodomonas_salina.1